MKKIFLSISLIYSCLFYVVGQNCPNSDFSMLNFSGWQGYTGYNNGAGLGCCPTPGIVAGRHTIISAPMTDPYSCGGLTVPPIGETSCARLGNENIGAEAEQLAYTFTVNASDPIFIYKYAVVLQDPGHDEQAQPFFSVKVLNSMDQIVDPICGLYEVYSNANVPGFQVCPGPYGDPVNWKDWTSVGINLSAYAGQTMKIVFTTLDCSYTGHFGYAYIMAECGASTIDVSFCPGTNTVVLTAPSGFTYLWSTGESTQSITINNPVLGSNYFCNVTAVTGCGFPLMATITPTILKPWFTMVSDSCSRAVSFTDSSFCNNSSIYSWNWNFGDGSTSTSESPTHEFPGQGTYVVSLTIATFGGCDSTITQTIQIGDVPQADFMAGDTCAGNPVLFTNLSTPLSSVQNWSWNFGDGSPLNSINWNVTHPYASNGAYHVILSAISPSGCTDTASQWVHIYPAPVIAINASPNICSGETNQISFGGTASPWTIYAWDFDGATVQSGSGAGPYSLFWADSGTHCINLQLTDTLCGAVLDTQQCVYIYPLPIVDAGPDTSICLGNSTALTATGGSQYSWFPTEGLSNSNIANPVASPQHTTTYTVQMTGIPCDGSDVVTITVSPLSPVGVSPDTTICAGQTLQFQSWGGVNYLWSPTTGLSAPNIANPTATPLSTTNYVVNISDGSGCFATQEIHVTVLETPVAAFALSTNPVCQDENVIINFTGTASNFADFTWDFGGATVQYGNGEGPYIISFDTSGVYTISMIVTENSCGSDTAQIQLTIYPLPIANAGNDTITCPGTGVGLLATGGTSYVWSPVLGLSENDIPNPIASPTDTTTYTVSVEINGCAATDEVTVFVRPFDELEVSHDTGICVGSSVTLSANGALSYLWSPATGLSSVTSANPVANPTVTTVYTLTGTAPNGCTGSEMVTISVNPVPTSSFTLSENPACLLENLILNYTGNAPANAVFVWDFSGATITSGAGAGPYNLHYGASGTYNITLDVSTQDCHALPSTLQVEVIYINAAVSTTVAVSCFGANDGAASAVGSGGDAPYTYHWSNGQYGPNAIQLSSQAYLVTISDANGCSDVAQVIVQGPLGPLQINMFATNASCQNSCNGSAMAVVMGGTSPYFYQWNNNVTQTSSNLTNVCPGNYVVTVSDDHGCTETGSAIVDFNTYIDATFITNVYYGNVPFGVNFTFTGTPADSYLWDFGDGVQSSLQNPSYTYITPGVYLVTMLISSGAPDYCTDTMSMYILANDISTLLIPDVFTPNSDGFNDHFEVQTYWILNYHLSIYNRWGRLMFVSDDPSIQWDGRDRQGIPASCGTYFYVLEAMGKDFKQHSKNGTVTLLR